MKHSNKRIDFSKENEQKIIDLYLLGETFVNLGLKFNCSDSVIKRIIKEKGIPKRKYHEKWSKEFVDQLIIEYKEGKSSLELARKYNVHDSTILDYLHKNNIEVRSKTHWKAPKLTSEDIIQNLITDYVCNETKTIKRLSEETGISALTIGKLFHKRGIPLNDFRRKWFFDKEFFKSNSWQTAYFYGFMLGDGCIYTNRKKNYSAIQIKIHKKDDIILKTFCSWLKLPTEAIHYYDKYACLILTSSIFKEDYSKFGLVPNKTYDGVAPELFDLDFLKPFLIGLIDSDGTIRVIKNKYNRLSITCSQQVINWCDKAFKIINPEIVSKLELPENKCWGKIHFYKYKEVEKIINSLEPEKYFYLPRKWNQLKETTKGEEKKSKKSKRES